MNSQRFLSKEIIKMSEKIEWAEGLNYIGFNHRSYKIISKTLVDKNTVILKIKAKDENE